MDIQFTGLIDTFSLDDMMGGGIPTSQVLEVYGKAGAGKTQLCMHITVNGILKNHCNAIYVDTQNSFSPQRISEIAQQSDAHSMVHFCSGLFHSHLFSGWLYLFFVVLET